MVDFIPQKDTMQGTQAITTNLPEVWTLPEKKWQTTLSDLVKVQRIPERQLISPLQPTKSLSLQEILERSKSRR
jgi:hypothetical protein